ncbi:MAG: DUF1540 domain-containing protein [Bacteriovoracia bacterium]
MKMSFEMPILTECKITECAYNDKNNCHAKAITVGDSSNPRCDTYFENNQHVSSPSELAGVGACKVGPCKFNEDFSCTASEVQVGMDQGQIKCLTFTT